MTSKGCVTARLVSRHPFVSDSEVKRCLIRIATSGLSSQRLQSCFGTASSGLCLKGVSQKVVFLILESLGSTELVFILVMALVFFGPRKLPQLSRTLGKNLASFRRASEDFKRTWDREASLDEFSQPWTTGTQASPPKDNSILEDTKPNETLQAPTIEAIAPDRVVPRQASDAEQLDSSATSLPVKAAEAEPLSKRDWL